MFCVLSAVGCCPYFLEQFAGKHEIVQCFVVAIHDLVSGSLPLFLAVFEEQHIVADLHDGVHVMAVDDRTNIELACDIVYQCINYQTRFRIQA